MNSPIRHGGPDRRIRKTVNSSPNRPIQATGDTINSIELTSRLDGWQIASRTAKGDMILERNAKLGRDPVAVTDKEIRLIENVMLDDFMRNTFG